jgi:hypothetical protein
MSYCMYKKYINTYLGVNIVLVIEVELALECHSDDMKCVKGGNTADGNIGRRWWEKVSPGETARDAPPVAYKLTGESGVRSS